MDDLSIFGRAIRDNLLFNIRGTSTVTDVWQLAHSGSKGLNEVDEAYQTLDAQLSAQSGTSRLKPKRTSTKDTLRLNVLGAIIDYEVARLYESEQALLEKQRKAALLEEKASRKLGNIKAMSDEELDAALA